MPLLRKPSVLGTHTELPYLSMIRILRFRVLYEGPLFPETPPHIRHACNPNTSTCIEPQVSGLSRRWHLPDLPEDPAPVLPGGTRRRPFCFAKFQSASWVFEALLAGKLKA